MLHLHQRQCPDLPREIQRVRQGLRVLEIIVVEPSATFVFTVEECIVILNTHHVNNIKLNSQ